MSMSGSHKTGKPTDDPSNIMEPAPTGDLNMLRKLKPPITVTIEQENEAKLSPEDKLLARMLHGESTDEQYAFDKFMQKAAAFNEVTFLRNVKAMQGTMDATKKTPLKKDLLDKFLQEDESEQPINLPDSAEVTTLRTEADVDSPAWGKALDQIIKHSTQFLLDHLKSTSGKSFTTDYVHILYAVLDELHKEESHAAPPSPKAKSGILSHFTARKIEADPSHALLGSAKTDMHNEILRVQQEEAKKSEEATAKAAKEKGDEAKNDQAATIAAVKRAKKITSTLSDKARMLLIKLAASNIVHANKTVKSKGGHLIDHLGPIHAAIFSRIPNDARSTFADNVITTCNSGKFKMAIPANFKDDVILKHYPVSTVSHTKREKGVAESPRSRSNSSNSSNSNPAFFPPRLSISTGGEHEPDSPRPGSQLRKNSRSGEGL